MAQLFDFNEKWQNENVLSATGSAYSLLRQIQWCYSDKALAHVLHRGQWCLHGLFVIYKSKVLVKSQFLQD